MAESEPTGSKADDLLRPGALFKRSKILKGPEDNSNVSSEKQSVIKSNGKTNLDSPTGQGKIQNAGAAGTDATDQNPGISGTIDGNVAEVDSDKPPIPVKSSFSGGPIVVNRTRQFGNPVLKHIRRVPYEWSEADTEMGMDFSLGSGCGAVYLSLKFHRLHPNYVYTRLDDPNSSKNRYHGSRILLVLTGMAGELSSQANVLRELNTSVEEAGEYLESLKLCERKTVDEFLNRESNRKHKTASAAAGGAEPLWSKKCDPKLQSAVDFLTTVRAINRSDAQRLLGTFGSLKKISEASMDDLSLCPGLGSTKAKNLYDAFRAPLVLSDSK